jgi:hypothetical protein
MAWTGLIWLKIRSVTGRMEKVMDLSPKRQLASQEGLWLRQSVHVFTSQLHKDTGQADGILSRNYTNCIVLTTEEFPILYSKYYVPGTHCGS